VTEPSETEATPATLQESALRELINARVVTGFVARGSEGGFVVEATMGAEPGRFATLGNTRNGPRVFASLSTVALLLRRLGIDQFMVDASKFVPGRVRSARPDRSEAMKAVQLPKVARKAAARAKRGTK